MQSYPKGGRGRGQSASSSNRIGRDDAPPCCPPLPPPLLLTGTRADTHTHSLSLSLFSCLSSSFSRYAAAAGSAPRMHPFGSNGKTTNENEALIYNGAHTKTWKSSSGSCLQFSFFEGVWWWFVLHFIHFFCLGRVRLRAIRRATVRGKLLHEAQFVKQVLVKETATRWAAARVTAALSGQEH